MITQFLSNVVQTLPISRGKYRVSDYLSRFGTVYLQSHYGPELQLRSGDKTTEYCVRGLYSSRIVKALDTLRSGDLFIDIGANVGIWSLYAARRVGNTGHVISFEPDFTNFRFLVNNIERNDALNIFPVRLAVSDENSWVDYFPGPKEHSGLGRIGEAPSHNSQSVRVPTTTLSNVLFSASFANAGRKCIVKIDVEGHEPRVISGLTRVLDQLNCDTVIVEIDGGYLAREGSSAEQIYTTFDKLGFLPLYESGGFTKHTHHDEVFVREHRRAVETLESSEI